MEPIREVPFAGAQENGRLAELPVLIGHRLISALPERDEVYEEIFTAAPRDAGP